MYALYAITTQWITTAKPALAQQPTPPRSSSSAASAPAIAVDSQAAASDAHLLQLAIYFVLQPTRIKIQAVRRHRFNPQ